MNNLEKRPHTQQGIPEEAFDLECPDEDLKAAVLKEFIVIDEKYLERLNQLEEGHEWTLRYSLFIWPKHKDIHRLFSHFCKWCC